ncbi:uncharacterized protein LOC122930764 isoform X12 [Bufo gargarizans]|uniref:uncharacterized protein LOC122930764 isoform X12 n=1 Tax=Bufo gargarizans TaxID=30331 RepID=UPI001CF4B140|nr:uncharacterized protein LOC122930764 isoform X12 [Bufo gargarizans]
MATTTPTPLQISCLSGSIPYCYCCRHYYPYTAADLLPVRFHTILILLPALLPLHSCRSPACQVPYHTILLLSWLLLTVLLHLHNGASPALFVRFHTVLLLPALLPLHSCRSPDCQVPYHTATAAGTTTPTQLQISCLSGSIPYRTAAVMATIASTTTPTQLQISCLSGSIPYCYCCRHFYPYTAADLLPVRFHTIPYCCCHGYYYPYTAADLLPVRFLTIPYCCSHGYYCQYYYTYTVAHLLPYLSGSTLCCCCLKKGRICGPFIQNKPLLFPILPHVYKHWQVSPIRDNIWKDYYFLFKSPFTRP